MTMGDDVAALIFDCDGVLIDSEHLASRVESELTRELGLELTVDEAHALFLGKTVDGVLDAIAGRTGTRPSVAMRRDSPARTSSSALFIFATM